MTKIYYRILTDKRNKYFDTIEETKTAIEKYKLDGDSSIKIFRIYTVEIDVDELEIDDELLALNS